MNGVLGKVFGWAQFGLTLLGGISQNGAPHGWAQWLTAIASLAAAVGIHAASNVGSVSNVPGTTTTPVSNAHISQ